MLTASFRVPVDHPSLAGHFPGNPLVPGVVTLDHVASALLQQLPGLDISGFPQVKFLLPVLPDMEVQVTYTQKKVTLYQFKCEIENRTAVSGQVRVVAYGSENG